MGMLGWGEVNESMTKEITLQQKLDELAAEKPDVFLQTDADAKAERDELKREYRWMAVTLLIDALGDNAADAIDKAVFIFTADRLAKWLVDGVLPKAEADGGS